MRWSEEKVEKQKNILKNRELTRQEILQNLWFEHFTIFIESVGNRQMD